MDVQLALSYILFLYFQKLEPSGKKDETFPTEEKCNFRCLLDPSNFGSYFMGCAIAIA